MSLKNKFQSAIEPKRKEVKELLENHGDKVISEITLRQVYGGLRGVKGLVTETSSLDPNEGIRFRGYPIPKIRELLPKAPGKQEPLPEGLFYLILTGELPTQQDCDEITQEWSKRSEVPSYVWSVLDALPKDTHPMTQFSTGVLALQKDSQFAKRYREGLAKEEYWDPSFEDSMNLLAKLPAIAAYIYQRSYKSGEKIAANSSLDWGANFAKMLGYENPEFEELMRLYLVIHADHEGGNVSAHTTHLVGSSLSDPYYCFSAGLNGLAGPLHGLANQEVIRWIVNLQKDLGTSSPTKEQLEKYVWDTLNSGKVVPGYGHAVLRATDPRYTAQREFALKWLPDNDLFKTVSLLYEVAPMILKEHGKAKNPWPNVDAHSGCLLVHYGMTEYDYYTVLFGVSRAMGVLASLCWDRALGLSIERPKSITTDWVKSQI
mgnify:CR=1 FL=1